MEIKYNVCLICKKYLTKDNTKVEENQKYNKYRRIICSDCFKEYYP